MKTRLNQTLIALAVSVLMLAPIAAHAFQYNGAEVDVEYWTGTGANEALCVVDFGANAYAFGYRWDGVKYGFDMIDAISAPEGGLDAVFQWGTFIDGLTYGSDSKSGYGGGEDWWHYWTYDTTNGWVSPSFGSADRQLTNGVIDGWGYGFATAPDVPTVPEPSSLLGMVSLIGLAGSAKLLGFRRK